MPRPPRGDRRPAGVSQWSVSEHMNTRVPSSVDDDLVEVAVLGTAERAGVIGLRRLERVVVEIEADDPREGAAARRCVCSRPAPKSWMAGAVAELWVVEPRDRRGVHYVACPRP